MSQLQRERMETAFQFISSYQKKEGISPTIREVQKYLGVSSSSTAYNIVKGLIRQGRIENKDRCPRTIKVKVRKEFH